MERRNWTLEGTGSLCYGGRDEDSAFSNFRWESAWARGTDGSSPSHHGAQKAVAIKEEAVVLEGTSEACEEGAARTECIATASMLRVEPQRAPNLIGGVPGAVSSSSNPPRLNIIASIRSFVPLVQQQQAAAPYPNGKPELFEASVCSMCSVGIFASRLESPAMWHYVCPVSPLRRKNSAIP